MSSNGPTCARRRRSRFTEPRTFIPELSRTGHRLLRDRAWQEAPNPVRSRQRGLGHCLLASARPRPGASSMQRIAVILNPNSRKNRKRAPGSADRLRRILGDWGQVHETRRLDELRPALESALGSGVEYLV